MTVGRAAGILTGAVVYTDDTLPAAVPAAEDAAALRQAIRDAVDDAFPFNTYDRLAATLGRELADGRYYAKAGRFLCQEGLLVRLASRVGERRPGRRQ